MTSVRKLPLWLRYLIAFGFATIVFVALVIYVHDHGNQSEGLPASPSKSEAAAEQAQDEILVRQEQAPHVVKPNPGATAAASADAAVTAYVAGQTAKGFIAGPLDGKARCTSTGGSSSRAVFSCKVTAGAGATRLLYPFAAVVEPAARKVTFCKIVTPPLPSVKEPPLVSACR